MRTLCALCICATLVLGAVAPVTFGQEATDGLPPGSRPYSTVKPWQGGSTREVGRAVASGTTIPMWSYTTTSSRDGQSYTGMMVGLSPMSSPNSTTIIPTQIVPLILIMPDGGTFDPTAPDPCAAAPLTGTSDLTLVEQSPIFLSHAYTMNGVDVGTTQYVDAFQQANFWSLVGDKSYHTLLSAPTLTPIIVHVAAGLGVTIPPGTSGRCGNLGLLADLDSFDQFVTDTLLPLLAAQGVNPTTFPIFLLSNVLLCVQGTDCGIFGYHSAVGSPPQTYAVSNFDTTGVFNSQFLDTTAISHEVSEWMDDPLGTNPTPPWGGIGQVPGCMNNLEVADPLTGTGFPNVTMPNGYTYHLQELAFFSWFFGAPSMGAGGLFSNNGTFGENAQLCLLALSVNTPSVRTGDTLTLTAGTTTGPTPVTVDVYIVLQLPGCSSLACLLFWQGGLNFTTTPQPVLRNWPISPFDGPIFSYTFGGMEPVGSYAWLGAFTVPGTLNLIGGITQAPFTFSP